MKNFDLMLVAVIIFGAAVVVYFSAERFYTRHMYIKRCVSLGEYEQTCEELYENGVNIL